MGRSSQISYTAQILRKSALAECKNWAEFPLFRVSSTKSGFYNVLCCHAFRTGNGCMRLSGTSKPTGTCWSGRDNSWRKSRRTRWGDMQPSTLYLGASSTFSWTCGTWWTKSAIRCPLLYTFIFILTNKPFGWGGDIKVWQKSLCSPLQMSYIHNSGMKPTIPPVNVPPNRKTSSKILWDSRVEGYIILRDLDFYLIKLARDFLLLASKTWTTQQWCLDNMHMHKDSPVEDEAEQTISAWQRIKIMVVNLSHFKFHLSSFCTMFQCLWVFPSEL